jgi:hypothetical protein
MVVGSIAPHTSEALVDVRAICHQPCCLLYWHTLDVRNHAEHAEVEISKSCTRKPAQRILDLRVFPRSRSVRVLEDESPASEQLDAHDQEAELEEDHRCRQTLLSKMPRDMLPIQAQELGEPGARGFQEHNFRPPPHDLCEEVRPVLLQRQIPP